MPKLKLTQGKIALISEMDVGHCEKLKWSARKAQNGRWYAQAWLKGQNRQVQLHRYILGATDPKQPIDHINHDGLDNRRENLRFASPAQNNANARRVSGIYRGVYPSRRKTKPYKAQISTLYLGIFATAEEAARAYDAKAKELFGEFATLNFPEVNV